MHYYSLWLLAWDSKTLEDEWNSIVCTILFYVRTIMLMSIFYYIAILEHLIEIFILSFSTRYIIYAKSFKSTA